MLSFCVVYAIEASDMAEQARLVIKSNSMQDRITVIHGKVEVQYSAGIILLFCCFLSDDSFINIV